MRVGYVPDTFGHMAQLQQILRGFGIDNAVFGRGVGAEAHKSEFYWAAPDGTQVLVIHLADALGYSNARDMPLNPQEFVARVELLTAPLLPKATTNTLLFMNGSDHLEPQDGLPETIEAANALLAHISPEHEKILTHVGHAAQDNNARHFDGIQVHIGTLPQYVETIRQQNGAHAQEANGSQQEMPLQVLHGEMRSSQYSHLLPAVLSTRMWINQQNTATEHMLERWMEPLTAWAWKLGAPYPKGLVKLAWKYLLQNHPHDSICGCSIDQVHRENSVRFAQSQQMSENLSRQGMQYLASVTDTHTPFHAQGNRPHADHEALPIVVFNPAPGPRTEAVQIVAQLPGSLKNAVIVDESGTHLPHHVVNRWRQELGSMPVPREIVATAVALEGEQAPGDFINMAETTITTMLGKSPDASAVSHLHVEDVPQTGVASIEVMLARRDQVTVNKQELLAAERQVLELVQREDISTLEFTLIDQARQTIDFLAADLPAYGFKTYCIYPPGLQYKGQPSSKGSSPEHEQGKVSTHPRIENEFYTVEVNRQAGPLTFTHKQTGTVFTVLNLFVDGGDVGDLYTYCPPANDMLISKPVEPPKIELVSPGPVRSILRVSGRWSLPSASSSTPADRSGHRTICSIVTEISLTPRARRVDLHTSVENTVKDHSLPVPFPVSYTVES